VEQQIHTHVVVYYSRREMMSARGTAVKSARFQTTETLSLERLLPFSSVAYRLLSKHRTVIAQSV
jgi:hypothetical protein